MKQKSDELLISVDVETSGPIPGEFSLLSIGACVIDNEYETFKCILKPINMNADPKALEVTGLSLETLMKDGLTPEDAFDKFSKWILKIKEDRKVVFVGFNAPFDWSFINYYFWKYYGENPFGFSALDIKAYYMGASGCSWHDTRSSNIAEKLHPKSSGDHDALHDALYQAELFKLIRNTVRK